MEENIGRAGLASVRIITSGATNVTIHVNGSVDATEVGNAEVCSGRQPLLHCIFFILLHFIRYYYCLLIQLLKDCWGKC